MLQQNNVILAVWLPMASQARAELIATHKVQHKCGIIGVMDARDLYYQRHTDWQALSDLLDLAQNNVRLLSPQQLEQLSRLYRAATGDLALARRDFPDAQVTQYLNQLVARGHAILYQDEPLAWARLRRFVLSGFPRSFRTIRPFFLVAAAAFVLPGLLVGAAAAWNPDAVAQLLPAQFQQLVPLIEQRELWTDIPVGERPYTSAFIMRNNIQVIFLSFAGGVLVGLFTIYILALNGLMIGALTGLTAHYDVAFELWTFVISHGVIELSVIFMAGGAGLALGWAIIHPGLLSRRDALAQAARLAVRIIIGAVPLLVVAGLLEGFVSPNEAIPTAAKWLLGIASGVLLYSYLLLGGRRKRRAH